MTRPFVVEVVAILLVALAGCAQLNAIVKPSQTVAAVEQATISEAVAGLIQHGASTTAGYEANAAKVVGIANVISADVSQPVAVTLASIQADINKALLNANLTPEELAPVQPFVTLLLNFLGSKVSSPTGTLSAADIAYVKTVVGWIDAEAALF